MLCWFCISFCTLVPRRVSTRIAQSQFPLQPVKPHHHFPHLIPIPSTAAHAKLPFSPSFPNAVSKHTRSARSRPSSSCSHARNWRHCRQTCVRQYLWPSSENCPAQSSWLRRSAALLLSIERRWTFSWICREWRLTAPRLWFGLSALRAVWPCWSCFRRKR